MTVFKIQEKFSTFLSIVYQFILFFICIDYFQFLNDLVWASCYSIILVIFPFLFSLFTSPSCCKLRVKNIFKYEFLFFYLLQNVMALFSTLQNKKYIINKSLFKYVTKNRLHNTRLTFFRIFIITKINIIFMKCIFFFYL